MVCHVMVARWRGLCLVWCVGGEETSVTVIMFPILERRDISDCYNVSYTRERRYQ